MVGCRVVSVCSCRVVSVCSCRVVSVCSCRVVYNANTCPILDFVALTMMGWVAMATLSTLMPIWRLCRMFRGYSDQDTRCSSLCP